MAKLRILLTDSMLLVHPDTAPIFTALKEGGHHVDVDDDLDYDFVAGPNCWYLIPEVAALFRAAVKVGGNSEDKARAVQQAVEEAPQRKPTKRTRSRRKAKSVHGANNSREGGE